MKKTKVYADCYQLCIEVFHRTKNFPRGLRSTLGRKIEESALDCMINLKKAEVSAKNNKVSYLEKSSDHLDELRSLIHLSFDLKALNTAGFDQICTYTKEIGREIGGFLKFERKINR